MYWDLGLHNCIIMFFFFFLDLMCFKALFGPRFPSYVLEPLVKSVWTILLINLLLVYHNMDYGIMFFFFFVVFSWFIFGCFKFYAGCYLLNATFFLFKLGTSSKNGSVLILSCLSLPFAWNCVFADTIGWSFFEISIAVHVYMRMHICGEFARLPNMPSMLKIKHSLQDPTYGHCI